MPGMSVHKAIRNINGSIEETAYNQLPRRSLGDISPESLANSGERKKRP
jgi:hypothetical protein